MDVDLLETTELKCKLGILSRSDGSAFFAEGCPFMLYNLTISLTLAYFR